MPSMRSAPVRTARPGGRLAGIFTVRYAALKAELTPGHQKSLFQLSNIADDLRAIQNQVAFFRGLIAGAAIQTGARLDYEAMVVTAAAAHDDYTDPSLLDPLSDDAEFDFEALRPEDFSS